MAAAGGSTEATPLLGADRPPPSPAKPQRTVTFNPQVSTDPPPNPRSALKQSASATSTTTQSSSQAPTALSAINNKLRRRHSQGASLPPPAIHPASKIGPQRTTRTAQKLKLLPDPEEGEDGPDEESGRDVYSQFTRIKDPRARSDAARLGKEDRQKLPRVTAYATAGGYHMDGVMRYFKGKTKTRKANPKQFDECIYTPYSYGRPGFDKTVEPRRSLTQRRFSDSAIEVDTAPEDRRESLEGNLEQHQGQMFYEDSHDEARDRTVDDLQLEATTSQDALDFDTAVHIPEVFLFDYGTVVIWGMTVEQEQRFLKEIAKFEKEKLSKDDVQVENFNFYYTREYQARIYNDFISLREKRNYMTKLAISHALSQSVKTSLFEDLVDNTIEDCKDIPTQIALTGKVKLSRKEINMQIGQLFVLRISIHLQGSVLDAPELMWAEPRLDPVYQAVRSYLEMDQRAGLLTERLSVIADLLAVLKDQLSHTHGEYLEWIVIILIAAEIVVAAINIVVDLYAGVD